MKTFSALKSSLYRSAVAMTIMLSGAMAITSTVTISVQPAFAQGALTSTQASSIQNSLAAALTAATNAAYTTTPGGPTADQQLTAAIEAAISNAEISAISTYGAINAAAITSAILSTPGFASLDSAVVGVGLAQAADTLTAGGNSAAAQTIALTVANEGTSAMVTSFASTTNAAGNATLASAAESTPSVTGANGGGTATAGTSGLGAASSSSGTATTCLNASCT